MPFVRHSSVVKNWQAANERRLTRFYRLVIANIWLLDRGPGTVIVVPGRPQASDRPVALSDNRSGNGPSFTNHSSDWDDRYQPDDRDTGSVHCVGSTQERLRRLLISLDDRSWISTILLREVAPATSDILLLDSPSCFDKS